MQIEKNFSLRNYLTFHTNTRCKYYCCVTSNKDIIDVLNKIPHDEKKYVLGNGSNTLFKSDYFDGLVIHNCIDYYDQVANDKNYAYFNVGAGMDFTAFVLWVVNNDYYGIENLVGIPGSVGGAVVQNVSAYGMEISNSIESVHGLDIDTLEDIKIYGKDCEFGYRDSIFKHDLNKMIITDVTFKLAHKAPFVLTYPIIENSLYDRKMLVNINNIAEIIQEIRKIKLPDHNIYGNAGCFFKNPIISLEKYESLLKYRDIRTCAKFKDNVKISAAYLIEQCGLKGIIKGNVGIYSQHSLVIINRNNASSDEIIQFSEYVSDTVNKQFGIKLEPEVCII